jgi:hypothetical protein
MLPLAETPHVRWFCAGGCVEDGDGEANVYVGGTLIGTFGPQDRGLRNVLLVGLASDPGTHLGHLAAAFQVSGELVRRLRRSFERHGVEALWGRGPGGSEPKLSASRRERLEELFEAGASVTEAYQKQPRGKRASRATVGRVRAKWWAKRQLASAKTDATGQCEEAPLQLALGERASVASAAQEPPEQEASRAMRAVVAVQSAAETSAATPEVREPSEGDTESGSAEEAVGAEVAVGQRGVGGSRLAQETVGAEVAVGQGVGGGSFVQHLGTWLMMAMVARLGLHRRAEAMREGRMDAPTLRLALDALVAALTICQRCVEGVRRLETPSAEVLLRAEHAPSASWVRRVLGRFAKGFGGAKLHLAMAFGYVKAERASESDAVVLYVDNHLRPYTGKHKLRKGWRMQDKRVLPGTTDYYVHDEDGRPVMRVDVASHDSLTALLSPIVRTLRQALGKEARMLVAFDRGGAFPEQMARLRDEGFEFVTYERRPYALLPSTAFRQQMVLDAETIGLCETSRKNLREGRGRVRRIALRMPDGRQVNLLATGKEPAERLVEVMRGRWAQENGLKHGVERWGANQLDGRTTKPWPPETLVPNPARRRLDRALQIARVREGELRSELARLAPDEPLRKSVERDLEQALALQRQLLAQRPQTPKKAPLSQTELAGDLVRHEDEYKVMVDTVRIACANAESELAGELGRHLPRAAEAKKALANLLCAPGQARIGRRSITVRLQPAGTRSERNAFAAFLADVNRWNLTLPGDAQGRRLKFQVHKP